MNNGSCVHTFPASLDNPTRFLTKVSSAYQGQEEFPGTGGGSFEVVAYLAVPRLLSRPMCSDAFQGGQNKPLQKLMGVMSSGNQLFQQTYHCLAEAMNDSPMFDLWEMGISMLVAAGVSLLLSFAAGSSLRHLEGFTTSVCGIRQ